MNEQPSPRSRAGTVIDRIGVDWIAVVVAGVLVAAVALGLLPAIPW